MGSGLYSGLETLPSPTLYQSLGATGSLAFWSHRIRQKKTQDLDTSCKLQEAPDQHACEGTKVGQDTEPVLLPSCSPRDNSGLPHNRLTPVPPQQVPQTQRPCLGSAVLSWRLVVVLSFLFGVAHLSYSSTGEAEAGAGEGMNHTFKDYCL